MLEIKQQFNNLSPQEQYEWLLKQDKSSFTLFLDNDVTELVFHEDNNADYVLRFTRYLGNCGGVELLLGSMGFDVQYV